MDCDGWTCDKFKERQTQIPFKTKKSSTTALGKMSTSENKENLEETTTSKKVVGEQVTKRSPTKNLQHGLPSPPPSKRKALGDIAFGATNSESATNVRKVNHLIEPATPSRRRIKGKPASEEDCVIISSPSRSQAGLVTPRSNSSTPRKRRKVCEEFTIWDSEDEGASDYHREMHELPSSIIDTPSRRGRKRKLA